LAMIGHNHHLAGDNPYDLGGKSIQYYANSVREHFNFNLFRVNSNGSYSVLNNQEVVENPADVPSLWKPNLTLTYTNDNNGTFPTNTAILVNKFNNSFPDAHVRFVMPKGATYLVSQGTVEQQFEGDLYHIVDVRVAIDANSTTNIEITPAENLEHNMVAFSQSSELDQIPVFAANISPELVIWNLGSNDEQDVPIRCEIARNGDMVYSSSKTADLVKSRELVKIVFDNWRPLESGTYYISYYTHLPNDQDTSSDTLKSDITVTSLLDDFETDFANWNSHAGWGRDNRLAHNGEFSLAVNPGLRYEDNTDSNTEYKYTFDLTSVQNPQLTFWSRKSITEGDSGFVEISVDGGITWERLGAGFNGLATTWEHISISLNDYAGSGDIRLRFRFVSDGEKTHLGWFIDDITIEHGISGTREHELGNIPNGYELFNNYPNPFNPSTTISWQLAAGGDVELSVYNLLGQKVTSLVSGSHPAGYHQIEWDAGDLPSGIYYYGIRAGTFYDVKKMILVR